MSKNDSLRFESFSPARRSVRSEDEFLMRILCAKNDLEATTTTVLRPYRRDLSSTEAHHRPKTGSIKGRASDLANHDGTTTVMIEARGRHRRYRRRRGVNRQPNSSGRLHLTRRQPQSPRNRSPSFAPIVPTRDLPHPSVSRVTSPLADDRTDGDPECPNVARRRHRDLFLLLRFFLPTREKLLRSARNSMSDVSTRRSVWSNSTAGRVKRDFGFTLLSLAIATGEGMEEIEGEGAREGGRAMRDARELCHVLVSR